MPPRIAIAAVIRRFLRRPTVVNVKAVDGISPAPLVSHAVPAATAAASRRTDGLQLLDEKDVRLVEVEGDDAVETDGNCDTGTGRALGA